MNIVDGVKSKGSAPKSVMNFFSSQQKKKREKREDVCHVCSSGSRPSSVDDLGLAPQGVFI
jgi:hypothetical protein